jgi:hypothetical protein
MSYDVSPLCVKCLLGPYHEFSGEARRNPERASERECERWGLQI